MSDFWLKLAYSNLWIALAAGAQVYVNFRLLESVVSGQAMLLATLAMFWVYTFAKAVHFDAEADQANDPARTRFLRDHRRPLIALGGCGLLLGSWLAWSDGATTLLLFWAPTLIGLAYDLKLLPPGFRYRRLKDVPGLKGTSVAFAWSVLTLGLCWRHGASAPGDTWLVLCGWNFLMWFINTTYFDLGDLEGDRLEGTTTLPVLLGYAATRRLLVALNGLAALLFLSALLSHQVQPVGWRLLWLHLGQAVLLWRARSEGADIAWECDVWFDGIFLLGALLLASG